IAVGLLVAAEELPVECVDGVGFLGELGLDGSIRPVRGTVPLADAVAAPKLAVPLASVAEATLVRRHRVFGAATLVQLLDCLRGEQQWPEPAPAATPAEVAV